MNPSNAVRRSNQSVCLSLVFGMSSTLSNRSRQYCWVSDFSSPRPAHDSANLAALLFRSSMIPNGIRFPSCRSDIDHIMRRDRP